jgi:hypothetical protein
MAIGAWFGTDFDEPQATLGLPAEVTGGQDPGVCVVDQITRGDAIVGRVTGDFGAVAIKIQKTDHPVRVTVALHLDEMSTRWWADRVTPRAGTPERPRLVLIRSQGQIRGAAVLARRQGPLRAVGAGAAITFDLPAAELGGLLLVEVAEPAYPLPPWAAGRFSVSNAIGVRVDRIAVHPLPVPAALPAAPTGSGCAFVVVGPGDAARFRLRPSTVSPAPPTAATPTNRWTRQLPARAAAKALRIARRAAGWAIAEASSSHRPRRPVPHAMDLHTGEPVAIEVVGQDRHGLDLRLATAPTGSVLIGLADARRWRRERTARQPAVLLTPLSAVSALPGRSPR